MSHSEQQSSIKGVRPLRARQPRGCSPMAFLLQHCLCLPKEVEALGGETHIRHFPAMQRQHIGSPLPHPTPSEVQNPAPISVFGNSTKEQTKTNSRVIAGTPPKGGGVLHPTMQHQSGKHGRDQALPITSLTRL